MRLLVFSVLMIGVCQLTHASEIRQLYKMQRELADNLHFSGTYDPQVLTHFRNETRQEDGLLKIIKRDFLGETITHITLGGFHYPYFFDHHSRGEEKISELQKLRSDIEAQLQDMDITHYEEGAVVLLYALTQAFEKPIQEIIREHAAEIEARYPSFGTIGLSTLKGGRIFIIEASKCEAKKTSLIKVSTTFQMEIAISLPKQPRRTLFPIQTTRVWKMSARTFDKLWNEDAPTVYERYSVQPLDQGIASDLAAKAEDIASSMQEWVADLPSTTELKDTLSNLFWRGNSRGFGL